MIDAYRLESKGLNMKTRGFSSQLGMRLALAVAASSLVAGCSSMRNDESFTGSISADYRERHPIVLRDAPRTLDIFAGHGKSLDLRQEGDIAAFARDYTVNGRGSIVAYVPNAPDGQRQMAGIRGVLSRAGLGGRINIVPYNPEDPTAAAPVRLSFSKLQAQVDSRCDEWSEDLAQTNRLKSMENRPVPNFGCSFQKNLAAQVAYPVDLVRPREETVIDSQKRINAVQNLRGGTDPSTIYRSNGTTINQAIPNP